MKAEDLEEYKQIDSLTKDGVCILTKYFTEISGSRLQVGKNFRQGYSNSITERAMLEENEPKDIVKAVYAIWGDTPTVVSPINPLDEEE